MNTMIWLRALSLVSAISCKKLDFFQLVDQSLPVSPVSSIQEINFVVLNSSKSVSDEWSLCSSMYVGFLRGRLTFFAVGQKNISRPWFSLFLTLDNGEFKSYFFAKKKAYNFGFLSSCLYQRQLNQHSLTEKICTMAQLTKRTKRLNFVIEFYWEQRGFEKNNIFNPGLQWGMLTSMTKYFTR